MEQCSDRSIYALLGLLVGSLSMKLMPQASFWTLPRLLSGVLMLLMGLYVAGWSRLLVHLEHLGLPLWHKLAPYAQRTLRQQALGTTVLAGMLWGFLPCGMVYSALAMAASSASPERALGAMLAFGAGTLPMMLATGSMAQQFQHLLNTYHLRQISGALLILMGLWTGYAALSMPGHHPARSMPDMKMPAGMSMPDHG